LEIPYINYIKKNLHIRGSSIVLMLAGYRGGLPNFTAKIISIKVKHPAREGGVPLNRVRVSGSARWSIELRIRRVFGLDAERRNLAELGLWHLRAVPGEVVYAQ
jgi:hypothetical protein